MLSSRAINGQLAIKCILEVRS